MGAATALLSVAFLCGCAKGSLEITQAGNPGFPTSERFKLAFAIENQNQPADGLYAFPNYDVILFKESPGTDGETTRYVRIRTLWAYMPGLNHTTESQLNCTVDYVRADRRGAALYQGAGLFHAVPDGGKFECLLKSAQLALRGRIGEAEDELGYFDLTGEFTAVQDPREHAYYAQRFGRLVEHLKRSAN